MDGSTTCGLIDERDVHSTSSSSAQAVAKEIAIKLEAAGLLMIDAEDSATVRKEVLTDAEAIISRHFPEPQGEDDH